MHDYNHIIHFYPSPGFGELYKPRDNHGFSISDMIIIQHVILFMSRVDSWLWLKISGAMYIVYANIKIIANYGTIDHIGN